MTGPGSGHILDAMTALARRVALSLVALALLQCSPAPEPLPVTPPPSVVVVSLDTLRADHLGCYGYHRDTSPNIDAFAKDGILFERAYAPMSTTLPSHISLFTSLNPLQHGVLRNFQYLKTALSTSDDLRTAAQMFAGEGYQTGGFVSCAPLMSHSGIAVGFDAYDEPTGSLRPAQKTIDGALQWLKSTDDRPLFLWVHLFDPHQPYRPPEEFVDSFSTDEGLLRFLKARNVKPTETVLTNNNDYDGSILYLDSQLERLFDELKARGLYDSSAIVLVGDHGEGLGQHGWMDHGPIYDEDLHVPLILKLPADEGRVGERNPALAAMIDVLPTLVETLQLPFKPTDQEQFSGINLLGDGPERRYVFSQRVVRKRRWDDGLKFSLTGRRWKYYHLTEGNDQLFDLRDDPAESRNVIEQQPVVAEKMSRTLLETIQDSEQLGRGLGEESALPPEVVEALESLGYVR
ncbi:MAG: choline-sulfatase [Pseudohongiellaceae bacterium]